MNDVFISYSRRDKVFVQKLYECLRDANRTVWADWDSIPASSDWFAEIKQGIEETDSVVFVLSPEWIKSNECRKEMNYAVEMGKRLFPILYIPVDPKDVPPELAKINWIYMRDSDDFDQGFQTLCTALDTDLEWIKLHTRIQVRALEWEKKKRDHSFVLRGNDLTEGEQFIASGANKNPVPTGLQSEYILASRTDATKRQRQTLAGVTVALVVSIALGVAAVFQWQSANKQAKISRNGELAAQSIALRETNFQLSLLLGLEAFNDGLRSAQSQTALLDNVQSHPQLITYLDGPHPGLSFAFSPDGKTLVSASADGDIKLWNISTHQQIGAIKNDTSSYRSIALAPDGKTLVSCSENGNIILWNIEKREQIEQLSDGCLNVAFSPDGKLLAIDLQTNIILWDVSGHKSINKIKGSFPIVFSPTSSIIAFLALDGNVTLWDAARQRQVHQLDAISPIAFSPDGQILASGNRDNNILLWDIETGTTIGETLTGYTEPITSVAFSPDGSIIASSTNDYDVTLWDMGTGKPIGQPLRGHTESVTNIAFSPDGKVLASASCGMRSEFFFCSRGEIILWHVSPDKPITQTLTEYTRVESVSFSPDGQLLAAGYDNNNIILWNIITGKPIEPPLVGHKDLVFSVDFSPDGETLASGSFDGTIIIWDLKNFKPITSLIGHKHAITSVAFSPDGKAIASSSKDGTIILWDAMTGESISQFLFEESSEELWSVDFSPDGNTLVSGGQGSYVRPQSTIILWDMDTKQPFGQMPIENILPVYSVAFSHDGKLLASGGLEGNIIIWDVRKKEALSHLVGFTSQVNSVAFSPDDTIVAAGGLDGTIVLWDIVTGKPIGKPLIGHSDSIFKIAFSSDGKLLASGSADTTIILWNVDRESWIQKSCQRAGRNFTSDEWTQYFPNEDYRETCPQSYLNVNAAATTTAAP